MRRCVAVVYGVLGVAFACALLLGCGEKFEVPTKGAGSIYQAAVEGDAIRVKGFLNMGFDVNEPDGSGKTLMHYAAENDHEDVLDVLVEEFRAEINAKDGQGRTPLQVARDAGAMKAVSYLEEEGAE